MKLLRRLLALGAVLPACGSSTPSASSDAGIDVSTSEVVVDAPAADAPAVDAPPLDAPAPADTAASVDAPITVDVAPADVPAVDAPAPDSAVAADAGPPAPATLFAPDSFVYQDVSHAAVDAESAAITAWLQSVGGWGFGRFQIDFSLDVLTAGPEVTPQRFTPSPGEFWLPDCDTDPVPLPAMGNVEGETGYACAGGGDCHLLVVQPSSHTLYEMWRANVTGTSFVGGCLAVWNTAVAPSPHGRGEQCTSADAGGLPIAPMLFDADEVAAGSVNHAIRFILPNARIRARTYVHPATHATGAASGPATAPPYGARLRLRADYPLARLPNDAARAVARGLQRYGMILADGGNIALTARSDRHSVHRWADLMDSHALVGILVTDFQMVDGGTRYPFNGSCVRQPR